MKNKNDTFEFTLQTRDRELQSHGLWVYITATLAFILSALLLFLPNHIFPASLSLFRDGIITAIAFYFMAQGLAQMRQTSHRVAHISLPKPQALVETMDQPRETISQPQKAAEKTVPVEVTQAQGPDAIVLLSLLQEKGRFIDFIMEDITRYSEAQVAAASRVVHQGCKSVMQEYLEISRLHGGAEGEKITIDAQTNPQEYRMVGRIVGDLPYKGIIAHCGWKADKINLPKPVQAYNETKAAVITPVEVEIK